MNALAGDAKQVRASGSDGFAPLVEQQGIVKPLLLCFGPGHDMKKFVAGFMAQQRISGLKAI
jgi:hypothetical protein